LLIKLNTTLQSTVVPAMAAVGKDHVAAAR
jgi:hypothetical protein